MLPIVYADDSRLLYESYTGTMLTSREIDGLEINAGYLTDQQRKSDDSHNSGLKSLTFGGQATGSTTSSAARCTRHTSKMC